MKKLTKPIKYDLLKQMCHIHAPSGNEVKMKDFILEYVKKHSKQWAQQPKIFSGKGFQDNIILIFGKPRTAIFAHMDSIGFTVRYGKQLVKIGGPVTQTGFKLVGSDSLGSQDAVLNVSEDKKTGYAKLEYKAKRDFERGTELVFKADWREDEDFIQCCYMDNRLGVYNALKVAETLKNGALVFSSWEEHGGGSVSYLQKFLQEKYEISQGLISDISWISDGVHYAKGPVISMRDSLIPRRSFINRIIESATKNKCAYQLEIEGSGGSDAKELQMAEYPWDWCFIGAAEENVHTPDEKVHKKDIEGMVELYKVLMKEL
ncbi:M20/M25/M40 family metallo-hydrolase [Aurantibacillus circumpalustris]|uniref:M20/M25/M40 family metallo-hydrolase n=1 Tax=Aurantibacillus circumpalustris TaxID=3036359 RepID=UPI00295C1250|nr:M20/M25/M40 family metallo-hydrolase [Aurantibacillus circumpalustris]